MIKHYNLTRTSALILSSCLICFTGAAEANVTTYSITDDFSTTANPNEAVQGTITTSAVPLPASFALFGSGLRLVSIAARRFTK